MISAAAGQQPPYDAVMRSAASSIGSCFSSLDDFDLDLRQLPNVANCKSSCDCCSLCRLPEVSEAGDSSAAEQLFVGDGTIATTSDTLLLHGLLPASLRHEPTAGDVALLSGASGLLRKLSSHDDKPSDSLSSVRRHSPITEPFVPFSITIPRPRIGPGSKGKEVIRRSASAYSVDNTDYVTNFLPDDALCSVLKFLDVKALLRLRECNSKLRSAASSNNAGWRNHCRSLWSTKANVCSRARSMMAQSIHSSSIPSHLKKNIAMEAYKTSVVDAATRKEVSLEELCFDDSPNKRGPIWSFRFKKSAGSDWTSWDPWWNDQEPRKMVFLRNGRIMQLQPQGKTHPSRYHNGIPLYDVFSERTVHRDGVDITPPRIELKWRFVQRPLDLPARPEGAYIRITVGGRDVPTYVVRRSPNGNWGFILESCWGVYASFDLAPRAITSFIGGGTRRRLRRTRNGSRWVNVDNSDSEDSDDDEHHDHARNVRQRTDFFVEESAMVVSGHSQWREALLYNIGAVSLPEGNNTSVEQEEREFDLAWRNSGLLR